MQNVAVYAWLGSMLAGCAAAYGGAWGDSGAPNADVYLYGPQESGGTRDVASTEPRANPRDDRKKKPLAGAAERKAEAAEQPAPSSPEAAQEPSLTSPRDGQTADVSSGTYSGTDRMTIELPGFPDAEQVDEKARVTFLRVDAGRYAFTVLDTNTGKELCSIDGELADTRLEFPSGQDCFDGLLGVPMQAVVTEGSGTVRGEELEVSLEIDLAVVGPNEELSGELRYRFEGRLSDPVASSD